MDPTIIEIEDAIIALLETALNPLQVKVQSVPDDFVNKGRVVTCASAYVSFAGEELSRPQNAKALTCHPTNQSVVVSYDILLSAQHLRCEKPNRGRSPGLYDLVEATRTALGGQRISHVWGPLYVNTIKFAGVTNQFWQYMVSVSIEGNRAAMINPVLGG